MTSIFLHGGSLPLMRLEGMERKKVLGGKCVVTNSPVSCIPGHKQGSAGDAPEMSWFTCFKLCLHGEKVMERLRYKGLTKSGWWVEVKNSAWAEETSGHISTFFFTFGNDGV